MRFRISVLLSVLLLFLCFRANADEGMWLPAFLSEVNMAKMQKMGLELTATDLYNINSSSLKDAVISLDGGSCTGELVSPEGLFLTNHHCGYSEIQDHSTKENNILKNGFWAKNKEEELPNPGKTVTFLIRVEDVTDSINAALSIGMEEDARIAAIEEVSSRLESEAMKGNHYEAYVKDLFESNRYCLFVTQTFRDVRLVATPPEFIGKFGGDTDNWMWPRHTGDFSIFRIYTAPDGSPADYSSNNIPFKPRHFFPISLKGYENGDFAMVMGYPGSTKRYLTSEGVKYVMDVVNDTRIKVRKVKLDIIGNYMDTNEEATIQYASKYARSSNYYKFSIGQNRGIERLHVIQTKKEIDDNFTNWVNSNTENTAIYGETLKTLKNAYANTNDDKAYQYIYEALIRGPEIFSYANRFVDLLNTLKFHNSGDKLDQTQKKMIKQAEDYFKDYNPLTDRKLAAELTRIYVENVSPEFYPDFVSVIKKKFKNNYEKWADELFKRSLFDNKEKVIELINHPSKYNIVNDPAYRISGQLFRMRSFIYDNNKSDLDKMKKGNRLYMAGLMEMEPNREFYANANNTMRLTWGKVGDYYPADAVHYDYFTTLKGYIEKEIPGDREFDVWPDLKELYSTKDYGEYADDDGTLHTCFITNNDITGGNSGSPVINGKGELIGIAFDGNWEAMSGDIVYEPLLQKCINVDIRFVLWTIDKFAGSTNLIDEMTIIR